MSATAQESDRPPNQPTDSATDPTTLKPRSGPTSLFAWLRQLLRPTWPMWFLFVWNGIGWWVAPLVVEAYVPLSAMLYAALGAVALVVVTVLVLSRVKKSLTFSRAIMNLALVLSILLFLIYGAAVCAPRVPLKNGSPALLTDLVRRVSDSDFRRANIPGLFVLLVLTTLLWVLATAARGYMAATRAAQEPPEAVQLARAVLCSFRTIQGIKEPGTEKESAEGKVAQVISVKRKRRNWETLISVVHMEVKEDAQENKFYTPSERRYLVKSSRMGSILSVEEQSRK